MLINIIPPGVTYPRKKFHDDPRVNNVVDLIFSTGNIFLKDIALLLTVCRRAGGLKKFSDPILKRWSLRTSLVPLYKIFYNLELIYNDSDIQNLKGAIIEVYTFKLMNSKYNTTDEIYYECNFQVDSWKSPKEVDVGAMRDDCSSGECYECKLGIGAISMVCAKDQIANLKDIFFQSRGIIMPKIASFEEKKAIEAKIKSCPDYFIQLEIYGRHELLYS